MAQWLEYLLLNQRPRVRFSGFPPKIISLLLRFIIGDAQRKVDSGLKMLIEPIWYQPLASGKPVLQKKIFVIGLRFSKERPETLKKAFFKLKESRRRHKLRKAAGRVHQTVLKPRRDLISPKKQREGKQERCDLLVPSALSLSFFLSHSVFLSPSLFSFLPLSFPPLCLPFSSSFLSSSLLLSISFHSLSFTRAYFFIIYPRPSNSLSHSFSACPSFSQSLLLMFIFIS